MIRSFDYETPLNSVTPNSSFLSLPIDFKNYTTVCCYSVNYPVKFHQNQVKITTYSVSDEILSKPSGNFLKKSAFKGRVSNTAPPPTNSLAPKFENSILHGFVAIIQVSAKSIIKSFRFENPRKSETPSFPRFWVDELQKQCNSILL